MQLSDWLRVITQLAEAGIEMVQFIGGEPTLHPNLPQLIDHALGHDLQVEVFSNLVYIRNSLWEYLERPGVCMATSYYSDVAAEHESITGRRGTHRRTKTNIAEVLKRSIPLRVGIIGVQDGQRYEEARAELMNLGIPEDDIVEILNGEPIASTRAELTTAFQERGRNHPPACVPDLNCTPDYECNPDGCRPARCNPNNFHESAGGRVPLQACGPNACLPMGGGGCGPSTCSPDVCNPHVCTPAGHHREGQLSNNRAQADCIPKCAPSVVSVGAVASGQCNPDQCLPYSCYPAVGVAVSQPDQL